MTLPVGSIIIWSKPAADIPIGWQVCNGSNGTPDLRGYFVYGASVDGDVGDVQSSGSHDHGRPAATQGAGAHTHSVSWGAASTGNNNAARGAGGAGVDRAGGSHGHSGGVTQSNNPGDHTHNITGDTNSEDILPPYMKLYYIMRVI